MHVEIIKLEKEEVEEFYILSKLENKEWILKNDKYPIWIFLYKGEWNCWEDNEKYMKENYNEGETITFQEWKNKRNINVDTFPIY